MLTETGTGLHMLRRIEQQTMKENEKVTQPRHFKGPGEWRREAERLERKQKKSGS